MSQNGSSDSSSYADENWAAWFCNLSGNQYFCEVEKSYMEDSFNLFGLKQHLPKDMIVFIMVDLCNKGLREH